MATPLEEAMEALAEGGFVRLRPHVAHAVLAELRAVVSPDAVRVSREALAELQLDGERLRDARAEVDRLRRESLAEVPGATRIMTNDVGLAELNRLRMIEAAARNVSLAIDGGAEVVDMSFHLDALRLSIGERPGSSYEAAADRMAARQRQWAAERETGGA